MRVAWWVVLPSAPTGSSIDSRARPIKVDGWQRWGRDSSCARNKQVGLLVRRPIGSDGFTHPPRVEALVTVRASLCSGTRGSCGPAAESLTRDACIRARGFRWFSRRRVRFTVPTLCGACARVASRSQEGSSQTG
jgi:hypothetical protein